MNFSFNAAPSNGGTGPSFGSTPFARPAQVSEPVARPTSAPRKLNEEREFIVDSYPLFASLQVGRAPPRGLLSFPSLGANELTTASRVSRGSSPSMKRRYPSS